jgi:hypothetical protein
LALLFWVEPAGRFLLLGAIALSALLAIACGAAATGRLAALVYNFVSFCSGRASLEKIMRENHEVDRPRNFIPHNPA